MPSIDFPRKMMERESAYTGNNRCPEELDEKIFKKVKIFGKASGKFR